MQSTEADDLPRVLLENYLLLSAAMESQNTGRLSDMLQYSTKVHNNLLEVMQQIEGAPTLAMTAGQTTAEDVAGDDAVPPTDLHEPAAATDMPDAAAGTVTDAPHPATADTQHQQRQQQQRQQFAPQQHPLPRQPAQQQRRPLLHHQQQPQHQQRMRAQQEQQQQHMAQQPRPPSLPPPSHQHQQQQSAPSWLQQVNVSVSELLGSLGLAQFVPLLEQQQVDMAALQLMEERHLRELGLPIGAVVKVRAALAAQQHAAG